MKSISSILTILLFSLFIIPTAEAQKKKSIIPIEPEFVQFWKEFQNGTKKVNSETIKLYTNDKVIIIGNMGQMGANLCTKECINKKEFAVITKVKFENVIATTSITDNFGSDYMNEVEYSNGSNDGNSKSIKTKEILKIANIAVQSPFYTVYINVGNTYSAIFAKVGGSYKIIAIHRTTE